MDGMNDKLDAVWAEYRAACPDPEPSADFMPRMWQRIEARRTAMTFTFRRVVQAWVLTTVALAIVLGVVVIPHLQNLQIYSSSYVDVLAADLPNTYVDILNGDIK
jgi:hypothetical protein